MNIEKSNAKPLHPYLVGKIYGSNAFNTDDWVILRKSENRPAKVRLDLQDPVRTVKVILGDKSDAIYGETCYYASDLGYPLDSRFWSPKQTNCYRQCNEERHLIARRESLPGR